MYFVELWSWPYAPQPPHWPGCAILGTGGGDELNEGLHYIDAALEQGKEFRLISVDDVPAGEKVCTPYMLGAISALSESEEKQYARVVSQRL